MKASLFDYIQFSSSLNASSIQINLTENEVELGYDDDSMIIYDVDNEAPFFDQYGFEPEEIIAELTEEEKQTFYQQLAKVRATKEIKTKRLELAKRLIEIKEKLTNDRKRPLQ